MTHLLEYWKPVVGFNDTYLVSSFGRIRRIKSGHSSPAGRLLCPYGLNGYRVVTLRNPGIRTNEYVHVLVMAAFVGPRPSYHDINHKDGNKSNNWLLNLEYVTRRRNVAHAYEIGLSKPRGTKLTPESVREIRRLGKHMMISELAKKYGVGSTTVRSALDGLTWKSIV